MNLDNIKEQLSGFIESKGYKLFEITYNKAEETLSVLLDEQMKMDDIESVSNEISQFLDQFENEFEDNYILDVSTVGAERPIRNEEELKNAIGKYIYVSIKGNEYNGTLKEFDGNKLVVTYKNKTRDEEVTIDYKQIKKVRYAVKF